MLRKKSFFQPKKVLNSSPMWLVSSKEVEVEVRSPLDGELLEIRKENVFLRQDVVPSEEVAKDTSDIYDILTQQQLGIQPVVCSRPYIVDSDIVFSSALGSAKTFVDEYTRQELKRDSELTVVEALESPVVEPGLNN